VTTAIMLGVNYSHRKNRKFASLLGYGKTVTEKYSHAWIKFYNNLIHAWKNSISLTTAIMPGEKLSTCQHNQNLGESTVMTSLMMRGENQSLGENHTSDF